MATETTNPNFSKCERCGAIYFLSCLLCEAAGRIPATAPIKVVDHRRPERRKMPAPVRRMPAPRSA